MPYIRKPQLDPKNIVYVSGPKGEDGSDGTPGAPGIQGPQGPQGPAGSGSTIGSANISITANGTLGVGGLANSDLALAARVNVFSTATRTLYGMLADTTIGNMNPIKSITNTGNFNIILEHNSASAAAAKDRFTLPTIEGVSYILAPGATVNFGGGYDYTAQRWVKALDTGKYTTYVVPGNGVLGDGTTDDRGALDTLANTTITSAGGQITFASGTYRIASNITLSANALVSLQQGAILKPDAGVTITINGDLQAGAYQIFDVSAAGSNVLVPGKRILLPQWYGLFPGAGSATTNKSRLITLLNSARSGYRLQGSKANTLIDVDGVVLSTGDNLGGIHLEDLKVKRTVNEPAPVRPGAVMALWHSSGGIDGITVDRCAFQGNSSTLDYSKALEITFANDVRCDSIRIKDHALEGIYCDGPPANHHWWVSRCHATNSSLGAGIPLAVYNINADDAFCYANSLDDSGRLIEHVGERAVIFGNISNGTAASATALQAMSTTYPNKLCNVFGNIITRADLAISAPTYTESLSGANIFGNTINRVLNAISCGGRAGAGQASLTSLNHISDSAARSGSIASTIFQNGAGGNVIQGNLIINPSFTTTGTIASGAGQTTMTVPSLFTNMHNIYPGTEFTVAGIVGTLTCTAVNSNRSVITFTPAVTGPVTNAVVTYYSRPFVYLMRSIFDDDVVFKDNTILDIPWTGTAFRFAGTKFTLTRNIWNPRSFSYGLASFIQIVDIAGTNGTNGGIGAQFYCNNMDITKDWTISNILRSVIYTNTEPPELTWKVGDRMVYTTPTSGGYAGKICTVKGTAGDLATVAGSAITADTTIGSPQVTFNGGTAGRKGVYPGCWITIAGQFGGAAVQVLSGASGVGIVSANATSTATGQAVAFSPPTWKESELIA